MDPVTSNETTVLKRQSVFGWKNRTTATILLLLPFAPWGRLDRNGAENVGISSITPCFEQVFASEGSGRRFLAAVVTLDSFANLEEGRGRLFRFAKVWKEAWPGLSFRRQHSFVNHLSVRGYGVLASFYSIMRDANEFKGDFDYLLLFEDDARPFSGVAWPSTRGNDLDSRLSMLEAHTGAGLILGGHAFRGYNKTQVYMIDQGIIGGTTGSGAYAFVLPKWTLSTFIQAFHECLAKKTNTRGDADGMLWRTLNKIKEEQNSTGGYISVPLLVDHEHGYSHTWQRVKKRKFEGKRDFWNFRD